MAGAVVTVMNMKGGVGKTTVSMNFGGIITRYPLGTPQKRRSVLLIDYDPQFNLSQAWIPAKTYFQLEGARKTTIAILQDNVADLDPYTLQVPSSSKPPPVTQLAHSLATPSATKAFDIVPSSLDLMYLALGQPTTRTNVFETRFKTFVEGCRRSYDLILIDCHPAGSILTKTSLQNSDHVLIPVMPQRYATRGVALMLAFIEANRVGGKAPTPHILFNNVSRRGVAKEERQIRNNRAFSPYCLTNTLKGYSAFAEPEGGRGFVWTSKRPYSTQAFHNLLQVVEEFLTKATI